MRTAIILVDWSKQIMFTPETDNEKEALKLITPDDNISTVIKRWDTWMEKEIFWASNVITN